MPLLDADHFQLLGNQLIGRQKHVAARMAMERYRATFGCAPAVASMVWSMIVANTTTLLPGAKPEHLLWALMFMKLHCSESVLAILCGGVHEQTIRKWCWYFIAKIANLQYQVIRWEKRFERDNGNVCLVSVDGTDFRIYQWKPFWKGWFSHKFKSAGLRYEVGVCILTGKVVWIHGPFPCGFWPDLKIFRHGLINMLGPGEKVLADGGYVGEPEYIVTPTGERDIASNVRGRHETVNKRFKQWGILERVFRHDLSKHQDAMYAVGVLTELSLEMGEPLFNVNYKE